MPALRISSSRLRSPFSGTSRPSRVNVFAATVLVILLSIDFASVSFMLGLQAVYTPITASNLQVSAQTPHLMQSAWLIVCASFFSPVIAFTGHFLAQAVQPLHLAASMLGLASALHWPVGQCL